MMNEIVLNDNNELSLQIIERIEQAEKILKEVKKVQDEYKSKLVEIMAERGIKDIENDLFKIIYYPENEKPALDTDKLKTEHEEVYLQCLKKQSTKAFVKITLK